MKNLFFMLCLPVLLCIACKTGMPSNSRDESTLMRIECNNNQTVKQIVLQLLRMSRAKDIVVDNYGVSLTIRAVYIDRDISQYKIESIGQELREMSGVIYVGIEENKNQVRNNLFQPAVY